MEDTLTHYGVPGMKWGVRKDKPKSTHRLSRETARYIDKGYDPRVAERKAKGRIRAQNILAATGGAVVAAAAGYLAYKGVGRHFVGVNLQPGSKMSHVSVSENLNITNKPMFTSFTKSDQKFYDSTFAQFAKQRSGAENIFKSTLEAQENIKAPSQYQAKKLYEEFKKSHPDLKKATYAQFNYAFNSETTSPILRGRQKEFMSFLSDRGYNAMLDNFDAVKSARFRTDKPTILFNPDKAVKFVSSQKLDDMKITTGAMKYDVLTLGKMATRNPKVGALIGLIAGATITNSMADRRKVQKYLDEHPNTTLTETDLYLRARRGKL